MGKPVIRASALPQLLKCPGSATLQPLVPPLPGDGGAEGTLLHYLSACELIAHLGATQPDLMLEPLLPPMRRFAEWIVGWYVRIIRESVPSDWSLEVEVPLRWEFSRFILEGHPDVLGISPDGTAARIHDLKSGAIPVEIAALNEQLTGYKALVRRMDGVDSVYCEIDQPLNSEDQGFPRRSWVESSGEALEAEVLWLEQRVNDALDHAMQVDSGMSQCRYCAAARPDVCPAIRAEYHYMKVHLTKEFLAQIKSTPDDAALGDIVISGRTLKGPIERAEEALKLRLDAQPEVVAGDGTKITMKIEGGRYEVTEPELMLKTLMEMLPTAALAQTLTYSTDRIIDAIAEQYALHKGGKSGESAADTFKAKLGAFVEQGSRRKLVFSTP